MTSVRGRRCVGGIAPAPVAVGLLGGYLVILGVYLVIGGFSLKWAAAPGAAASGTEQHS